jgi:hypothetical protein
MKLFIRNENKACFQCPIQQSRNGKAVNRKL